MPTELWPPLNVIRSAFEPPAPAAAAAAGADAPVAVHPRAQASPAGRHPLEDLLLPLTELARRREAVAARAFPARWAPGRLVSVLHDGRLLGVLLDRCTCGAGGERWHGWMAASEADWASACDVLLEPGDEPFEPLFGMVQTWNPVTLVPAPQLCARVLGEVSATRLAALRAVADECAARAATGIAPVPGRIALRTVADTFTVLSGTPLAPEGDPRTAYQALYAEAAARLNALSNASTGVVRPAAGMPRVEAAGQPAGRGTRLRGWLLGDGVWRPALAVLALVVVVQNAGLLLPQAEEVRFRGAPPATGAPAVDLTLRWKAGTDMAAAAQLLRSAGATVVGGPDAAGTWSLHLLQPAEGRRVLQSSPLVEAVGPP
ncbi:MAG: hypothetical protein REJ24_16265 [Rhodocyclaceae bacterium]|nr:hypothetical protein [Rhodocyclaceae bacterium]MDQ8019055.1 hypothetical protein [Pseudomonadota bacterium]